MGTKSSKPSATMMPSYEQRAQSLQFTPKDDVKALVEGGSVTFLDVRGEAEIAEETLGAPHNVVYTPCSRTDASALVAKSGELLPDKDAAVIVFCKSGARSKTAKDALEKEGYTKVYNAGGIGDMDYLK